MTRKFGTSQTTARLMQQARMPNAKVVVLTPNKKPVATNCGPARILPFTKSRSGG